MPTPTTPDGFLNVVITGTGSDINYTVPADVYSIIFRAVLADVTIDDENGVAYILPAGQAEAINSKALEGIVFTTNQAAGAGQVLQIRELYGRGV